MTEPTSVAPESVATLNAEVDAAIAVSPELKDAIEKLIEAEKAKVAPVASAEKAAPAEEEVQIAEVISAGSLPGVWNVHIRYINDQQGVSSRALLFGPVSDFQVFPLWKSKADFVEVQVSDYSGKLLVPCPEVVSV